MKNILLVEDEESLRHALSEKFKHEGFSVTEVGNGKAGLEMALLMKPDVILLDIIMPIMDGMTMLKLLREDSWGKNAKVILLTNLNDSEQVSESMKEGVFDYLIKTNWALEDLVKLVKEKLN